MLTEGFVARKRAWLLLALALWAVMAVTYTRPRTATAQEEKAAAAKADGAAPEGEKKPQTEGSTLWWFIKTSGFIGFVLLCLSIYFVATVGRMFFEMRPEIVMPPDIVGRCEDRLAQKDLKGVFEVVGEDESFFGRVLAAGIKELPNGLADARENMERLGEALTVEMEKKISMLAVLGTLGPMIGLLGTLKGMIASFSVIAMSGTELKASEVAGGISEALLLTFEGVALSVPSIYFFALFRNRVGSLSVSTMLAADEFLRHFSHAARAAKKVAVGAEPAKAPQR